MLCKHCGEEIPEKGKYCSMCGKPQEKEDGPVGVDEVKDRPIGVVSEEEKDRDKKAKRNYLIYGALGIAVLAALVFIFTGNPVNKYINHIDKGEYKEASILYEEKISGDEEAEYELKEKLTQDIENILDGYINKTKEYEKAKSELSVIEKTGIIKADVKKAVDSIDELDKSRIAFSKGVEFDKSGNYLESIIEYRKVIETDDNYKVAKENIEKLSKIYEEKTIKELDLLANEEKYGEAVREIKTALKALPNSQKLQAKLASYEKLEEEKAEKEMEEKIAKLKENQEVAVVDVSQYNNSINTNFIAVTVENRSDKTVKRYSIGFMGFDKNNLPVKVGLGGRDFVGSGYADQNILPGESKYSNGGWYLDNHDVVTLIACISEVEYYDGDNWRNPYYNLWLEKYQEKPLK